MPNPIDPSRSPVAKTMIEATPTSDSSARAAASSFANDSASGTNTTERGWDGWPTPETPDYLVPKMRKDPISSTAHFQTVAITRLEAMSAAQRGAVEALVAKGESLESATLGALPQSAFMRAIGTRSEGKLQDFLRQQLDSKGLKIDADTANTVLHAVLEITDRNNTTVPAFEALGVVDPLAAPPDASEYPAEGVILYHEQGWYAQGLALGNLLHSVALAPGEVTQIAMTHWNHSTKASDSETVSQSDSTSESDTQDRSVTEIQQAAADEHTNGGSSASSDSTSSSYGVSRTSGEASLGWNSVEGSMTGTSSSSGSAHTASNVVSYSDGSKRLSMSANQKVAATTSRHAEAARTRRATVVREVTQSEDESLTTRVLANYNHMHALTIMYFEVIEVYKLVTRVVDAERLVFVPFRVKPVSELVGQYRAVLVDRALAAGKPHWARVLTRRADVPATKPEELQALQSMRDGRWAELMEVTKALDISQCTEEMQRAEIKAFEMSTQYEKDLAKHVEAYVARVPEYKGAVVQYRLSGEDSVNLVKDGKIVADLNTIPEFRGLLAQNRKATVLIVSAIEKWKASAVRAWFGAQGQTTDKARIDELFKQLNDLKVVGQGMPEPSVNIMPRVARARAEFEAADVAWRLAAGDALKDVWQQIEDNRLAFNQAVWLSLSPGQVLGLTRRVYKEGLLCEQIDPAPVAVTGNYVGYRWRFRDRLKAHEFKAEYVEPFAGDSNGELNMVESTIAVPTGGVFGEAVLGQAVSAEKIDLSRFWNWKDSMIPILPTSINPLTAATPQIQNLDTKPMSLDASSAKLGALQDLPAPSGLGTIAGALQTSFFRDMSGQSVLQSLAEATTVAAEKGNENAANIASANLKAGLDFVSDMAGKAIDAYTTAETGGVTKMGGIMGAKSAAGAGGGGGGGGGIKDAIGSVAKDVATDVIKDNGPKPAGGGSGGNGGGGGSSSPNNNPGANNASNSNGETPSSTRVEPKPDASKPSRTP